MCTSPFVEQTKQPDTKGVLPSVMGWDGRSVRVRVRGRGRGSAHACEAQECEGERVRPAVRQLLRQQHLPSPLNTYTSMYVTFLSSSLCPWVALNHNTHCSMPATFIGILHSQPQQIPFIWSFLLNYTCPTQHHSYPHGWPRPSSQLFRLYALAQEIPGMFYITKTCPSSLHKCLWYLCFLHLVFLSHPHIFLSINCIFTDRRRSHFSKLFHPNTCLLSISCQHIKR